MRRFLIVALSVLMLAGAFGCTFIKSSDALNINDQYSNAKAIAAAVQKSPTASEANAPLPQWVKDWFAYEAQAWYGMDMLATRKAPAFTRPTTLPALP